MLDLSSARQGPLDGLATRVSGAASLTAVPPMARFVLRHRPDGIDLAGQAFGLKIPQQAGATSVARDRSALWLGPDEWLLIAPETHGPAIAKQLAAALALVPFSLVDVSHRNAALQLEGPKAAALLNHGCPLDLSPEAFPVGNCTRTIFSKAEIVLWRIDAHKFWIETGRSFATYVWRLLEEARLEFE